MEQPACFPDDTVQRAIDAMRKGEPPGDVPACAEPFLRQLRSMTEAEINHNFGIAWRHAKAMGLV